MHGQPYISRVSRVICLWDLEEERKIQTSFRKSPKYKVLLKSIEWALSSCMRMGGQMENRETFTRSLCVAFRNCSMNRPKYKYSILVIKSTRCTNSQNYFWNKTLHVSDSSSVHHQELFTVHTAMVYVIQVC